jgi:(p)ppGpp synthase/HD superfamily hydrolase
MFFGINLMVTIMKINYAMRFAAEKHKDQKRKITQEAYIFHPLEVALTVAQNTSDQDVIIAAILHDTLEDTDTTVEEIETNFGSRVLSIILECSEKDKTLPWRQRKIKMLNAYPDLSEEACLIILADKISNLNSIKYYYSNHIWDNFNAGEEDQKWICLQSLNILKQSCSKYPKLINQFRALITTVFPD